MRRGWSSRPRRPGPGSSPPDVCLRSSSAAATRGSAKFRISEVTLPISPDPIVVSQSYFNQFNLRLGVQQPLFTGFRLQAAGDPPRLLEAAAGQDLEKNRAELAFAVKAAYWGLARSREFEKVIDENVRQVGEHLKDVRAFSDQGLATRNDVLRAELELSNAEIMRIDARDAAEVALTALVSLIGLPLDSDIDLTTSAESRASRIPAEAGTGDGDPIERALAQRPEIKSAEFRIKASEMGVKAVRSALLTRRSTSPATITTFARTPGSCPRSTGSRGPGTWASPCPSTFGTGVKRNARRNRPRPGWARPGRPAKPSKTRPSWRSRSAA
ncbi:MAG: TolC family protein [Candidatus Moduliflexus flocculans]|nr:TolC family protein [Candidatus Moduliflexus flocculans]